MQLDRVLSRSRLERIGKVLVQTGKDFFNDNGPQWAAAIAFYTLLSVFPLLLAAAAIAAYFVDAQWAIEQGTRLLGDFLPRGEQYIRQIVQDTLEARGSIGLFSFLVLLWTGSRVFGVITMALNIAYDANESYGFLKRTLIEILMTLTIGILFVLALGSRLLIAFIEGFIQTPAIQPHTLLQFLGYAVPAALLLISLFLTYQYVPRRRVEWWVALIGAVLFTALFLLARPLFTGYIQTFSNYNLIYGPLAIVIILVLWTWIAASLLLLGGELVSHIQDMLIEQKTQKEVETRHEQRDPTSPQHAQSEE